jgi:hypothetical protein
MNLNALKKHSAGFFSIAWVLGGFALCQFGLVLPYSPIELPFIVFGWLGVGLMLAIAGLRRGSLFGKICGGLSMCVLLLFTVSLFDPMFGDKIENLFRKDEYAMRFRDAPEYNLRVSVTNGSEFAMFDDTVKRFALSNGFHECRNKIHGYYSGQPRCTYKSDHAAIWSEARGNMIGTNVVDGEGVLRIVQYDESYPVEDFKKLAGNLVSALRSKFGDQVGVSVIDAGKFN